MVGPDDWGWYGLGAVYLVPTIQAVGKYEEFARPAVNVVVKNRAWTEGPLLAQVQARF
jgi:hypothetical protein